VKDPKFNFFWDFFNKNRFRKTQKFEITNMLILEVSNFDLKLIFETLQSNLNLKTQKIHWLLEFFICFLDIKMHNL
jgi:hypothetical protein